MTEAKGSGAHQAVSVGGGAPARRRGHLHHETDQMVWREGVGHGYNESLRPRYLFFFFFSLECHSAAFVSVLQPRPGTPGAAPQTHPLPCPGLAGRDARHNAQIRWPAG